MRAACQRRRGVLYTGSVARPNRKKMLEEWLRYEPGPRMKDERARAAVLRLSGAVVPWLEGRGEPPGDELILKALKCKPSDALFRGATALQLLAALEGPPAGDAALRLFPEASIRACREILRCVRAPARAEVLAALAELGAEHWSADVRADAVSFAYSTDVPNFETLAARAARDLDPVVQSQAEKYSDIRRQGYHANFIEMSWDWMVEFQDPMGIVTANIPKYVVDRIGIPKALEHVREALKKPENAWVEWDKVVEGA